MYTTTYTKLLYHKILNGGESPKKLQKDAYFFLS